MNDFIIFPFTQRSFLTIFYQTDKLQNLSDKPLKEILISYELHITRKSILKWNWTTY